MSDIKKQVAEIFAKAVPELTEEQIQDILEVPSDKKMGDLAFPCFRLAKIFRKAPQMIAADIAGKIQDDPAFESVKQVNAYVNVVISKDLVVRPVLAAALADGYGKTKDGEGKKIVIDYSSPNIAKPFHIGHIRSTVIGNALYHIFDTLGYDVVRTNHLGDYGTQFGKMICAYRHWGSEEEVEKDPIRTLLHYYTKFHEEAEKDQALNDEARKAFYDLEHGGEEEIKLWKWFTDLSLREFNRVYDLLGITFDAYDGERMYAPMTPAILKELTEKGLLEESQGVQIVDLEKYGLPPALITKSDGASLYCTRDLATAEYRKEHYDFYKNIYVVASQQTLYFKQLKAVLERMGYEWSKDCVHVPFGMVSMKEGTLSTRKGRVVFLEDVLNKSIEKTREIIAEKNPGADQAHIDEVAREVGVGAVVFNELSNSRIKDYVFDWDRVLNFDGETGPYVQYTHARCCSVLRKAGDDVVKTASDVNGLDLSFLAAPAAYDLVKEISDFPQSIRDAADRYEPSIVTRHIIDIAQAYNKFYHDEHILVDNEDEKKAKVALTLAAEKTIAAGLGILGIAAPERM